MSSAIGVCPPDAIDLVHTGRPVTEHTPVQATLSRAETGTVEIFAAYAEGLGRHRLRHADMLLTPYPRWEAMRGRARRSE